MNSSSYHVEPRLGRGPRPRRRHRGRSPARRAGRWRSPDGRNADRRSSSSRAPSGSRPVDHRGESNRGVAVGRGRGRRPRSASGRRRRSRRRRGCRAAARSATPASARSRRVGPNANRLGFDDRLERRSGRVIGRRGPPPQPGAVAAERGDLGAQVDGHGRARSPSAVSSPSCHWRPSSHSGSCVRASSPAARPFLA